VLVCFMMEIIWRLLTQESFDYVMARIESDVKAIKSLGKMKKETKARIDVAANRFSARCSSVDMIQQLWRKRWGKFRWISYLPNA